jgi:hypothetical protein
MGYNRPGVRVDYFRLGDAIFQTSEFVALTKTNDGWQVVLASGKKLNVGYKLSEAHIQAFCKSALGMSVIVPIEDSALPIPTPEEFKVTVDSVISEIGADTEVVHSKTDDLMEELLVSLGYQDAVESIRKLERWYS